VISFFRSFVFCKNILLVFHQKKFSLSFFSPFPRRCHEPRHAKQVFVNVHILEKSAPFQEIARNLRSLLFAGRLER